jgi:hypothetical protein
MDWQSAFTELEAATVDTFGEPVIVQSGAGQTRTIQVAFDSGDDVGVSRRGNSRTIPIRSKTLVGLAKRSSLPDDFEEWIATYNGNQYSLSEGDNEDVLELWLVFSPVSNTNGKFIRD